MLKQSVGRTVRPCPTHFGCYFSVVVVFGDADLEVVVLCFFFFIKTHLTKMYILNETIIKPIRPFALRRTL